MCHARASISLGFVSLVRFTPSMVTVTVMDMAAIPVFGLEKEAVVKEVQARNACCCSGSVILP